MKLRWMILALAGLVVLAVWATIAITFFFFHPSLALWTGLVTLGAFSLEGFLWVAAGVVGWSFLAKRREMLAGLKRRFFGVGRGAGR